MDTTTDTWVRFQRRSTIYYRELETLNLQCRVDTKVTMNIIQKKLNTISSLQGDVCHRMRYVGDKFTNMVSLYDQIKSMNKQNDETRSVSDHIRRTIEMNTKTIDILQRVNNEDDMVQNSSIKDILTSYVQYMYNELEIVQTEYQKQCATLDYLRTYGPTKGANNTYIHTTGCIFCGNIDECSFVVHLGVSLCQTCDSCKSKYLSKIKRTENDVRGLYISYIRKHINGPHDVSLSTWSITQLYSLCHLIQCATLKR